VTTRRTQGLALADKALFNNPQFLRSAEAPAAAGIDNRQRANEATILIHIHKDSEQRLELMR
jgi:hypothetical protein